MAASNLKHSIKIKGLIGELSCIPISPFIFISLMAYDYTVLSESLALVTDLTTISSAIKLRLIEQNLEDSAGTVDNTTYYRPYYVAGRQLQRNRDDQTLEAADGAEFTNLTTMIRSLFEEQIALDSSLGLDVPGAYNAQLALDRACGCQDEPESSAPGIMTLMSA